MNASARYRIRHVTEYAYGSDVVHSHQLLHLVPRPNEFQECSEHRIEICPAVYRRSDGFDAFGNPVTRIEIEHPHRHLDVTAEMDVYVHARPPVSARDTFPWERVVTDLRYNSHAPARESLEASRFRHESPYVRVKKMFTEFANDCFPEGRPILAGAAELMTKLHRNFKYSPGETTVATPVTEVLRNRRGVCQDFAHLMIACLRSRGLSARYVSGYVRTFGPKDAKLEEVGDAESECSGFVGGAASHAWVSVYCPPLGWIDLDPTNDTYVGTDHVSIAWGRDFGDVSPLRGVILGGGTHRLDVNVSVERLGRESSPA